MAGGIGMLHATSPACAGNSMPNIQDAGQIFSHRPFTELLNQFSPKPAGEHIGGVSGRKRAIYTNRFSGLYRESAFDKKEFRLSIIKQYPADRSPQLKHSDKQLPL
jgi:hypothetical protein